MTGAWAIIPVKGFAEGKSRLSPLLDPVQRQRLNADLCRRTIDIAQQRFGGRIVVITGDDEALRIAEARHVQGVREAARGGLNAALTQAAHYAATQGAERLFVLPTDLPWLGCDDLDALALAAAQSGCVIAPDRHGSGTNALAFRPRQPDLFRFGRGSFSLHLEAYRRCGIEPAIVRRPGLAFDLDRPEDYRAWRLHPAQAEAHRIARAG